MTMIYTEGFELITSAADLTAAGLSTAEGSLAATASKWGGQAWDLGNSANNTLALPLQDVADAQYMNIALWRKWSAVPGIGGEVVMIGDLGPAANPPTNTGAHVVLYHVANGGLQMISANGLVRQQLFNVIQANTWMHFELRVFIDHTVGTLELWIDGIKVVDLSGLDTRDGGAPKTFYSSGQADSTNCYVDDVVIHEGTGIQPRIGMHRIHTLFPDGNGTNTAWTGTSTDVDDPVGASDGDTTFAVSDVLNAKQDYTIDDLSVSPATIKAVVLKTEARKTDAGVVGMTQFVISNAVTGNGTEFGTTETYSRKKDFFELNPDGDVAWTEATVNAVQIGHEITTV